MGAVRIVKRSTRLSLVAETVEGTAVAETAAGAVMTSEDGAEFVLDRDLLESGMMSGSFSKDTPEPGIWTDDLGFTLPTKMRGYGTLGANGPDWHLMMESVMGTEIRATAGVVATGSTALTIQVKSGCDTIAPVAGMLLYFPSQDEIRRIQTFTAAVVDPAALAVIVLDTPLSAVPAEDELIKTGVNWMLSSSPSHPFFTAYAYFDEDNGHRLRYTSCKTTELDFEFEVGGHCDMTFKNVALSPLYDTTSQAVTPVYDHTTKELTCLGVDGYIRVAGTAYGSPTTTETILATPNYDVRVGDKIQIEVSSGVWETKAISVVSGNAGGNVTLTHAAVSIAADALDTVYILRGACADIRETLSLKVECPVEFEKCMFADYGKTGSANVGRTVTIEAEPYFQGWEQFLMRDNSTGQSMMVVMAEPTKVLGNIVALYIPKKVVTTVGITNDDLMKNSVTSRAVKDAVLGDDHEFVIAAF